MLQPNDLMANPKQTHPIASDHQTAQAPHATLSLVFSHVLLGHDYQIRQRIKPIVLAITVYVVCCGLAFYATSQNIARTGFAERLLLVTLIAESIFYGLVRSGFSNRFKDPGLVMWQIMFALAVTTYAYLMINSQHRGAVLMIEAVTVMFGMYTLTPKQANYTGLLAVALIGTGMLIMTQLDPSYYPWREEVIRFELLLTILPALSIFTRLIAHWRDSLIKQKRELRQALACVQDLATHDTLTGLFNRRHMQDLLEHEWQRQERLGLTYAIALVDLDFFKQINDRYGHRIGDEVLQHFASTAAAALRSTDVIARWGGEEFLILFRDSNLSQAQACMQRLSEKLAQQQVCTLAPELRVCYSAGLAQQRQGQPLDHTLERADQALYRAKAAGRNRILMAYDSAFQTDHIHF